MYCVHHMGRSRSACVMEFTVSKEFTVRKEFTVQQKKSERSSPHVVHASYGAKPKCVHHRFMVG